MYRPFIFIVSIGIVLVAASQFGLVKPLQSVLNTVIEPVLAAETSAANTSVSWLKVVASIRDLARENAELKAKNQQLESELAKLKEVAHENEILRQELKFAEEGKESFIPSQLIGRTTSGIIKDLIINQGEKSGVKVGQAVIAEGYLVGLVNTVLPDQATVQLITNPRSLVPVVTQTSRASGILRGGISGLVVNDLLIDADIKQAEAVLTSGLGGDLPADIPVGTIIESNARKGDIMKRATVRTPLDISRLEMVFVRKGAES